MEIFNLLSVSNRYNVTKYLSKYEIKKIVTLIDNSYFNFSSNNYLLKFIDFPEVCKWMNQVRVFETPEILEKDEICASKKYRCMYCNSKNIRCNICKTAKKTIKSTKKKITKLRNKQDKVNYDYENNPNYLFHNLDKMIDDLYDELNEIYCKWEYQTFSN